jgi:hypothetical protein
MAFPWAVAPRRKLLVIVHAEVRKHDFDCFLDASAPLPPDRKGVVAPGCPYCKKTFYTMAQFIERLSFDVLPLIFERERELINLSRQFWPHGTNKLSFTLHT